MQKTYTNPIARHGDFADPFVLRHDGRYYLYGTNPDVRCWVSDNLIDWTLCGAAIAEDEFPELVPFAPEVVYHNGFFYMYTSPHGRGHYVLRSDKPTGPYKKITGNIGHAIDSYVRENGYSVVRKYIGHGVGRDLHEDPEVPNFGTPGRGQRLCAGMVIAIEPMVNVGTHEVKELSDGWTVVTADGKLSAHYEHTVAVTGNGAVLLTDVS